MQGFMTPPCDARTLYSTLHQLATTISMFSRAIEPTTYFQLGPHWESIEYPNFNEAVIESAMKHIPSLEC